MAGGCTWQCSVSQQALNLDGSTCSSRVAKRKGERLLLLVHCNAALVQPLGSFVVPLADRIHQRCSSKSIMRVQVQSSGSSQSLQDSHLIL